MYLSIKHLAHAGWQKLGERGSGVSQKVGASPKGGSPNNCPQRLSKSFQRSHHPFGSQFAFGEFSTKATLLSERERFQQKSSCFQSFFTKAGVLLPTSATLVTWNIRNQKVLYYTYQVPYKMKFESETLHTCTKLSGKPLQYTKKDKFESIIKFLSARWQLD